MTTYAQAVEDFRAAWREFVDDVRDAILGPRIDARRFAYLRALLDEATAAGPEGDHALTIAIVNSAKRELRRIMEEVRQ
jgi:hypothetical protein